MFWLPIPTTAGSRSSRLRVRFSAFWEPREAARDNSEHRTASLLIALATSTWRTLPIIACEKLAPDGTFIAEWKGPEPGFYGPRRIAIGPDDSIYVVDQGHNRIAKFSPDGEVLAVWGTAGNGDGQFNDPTSVAVDPATNKVYVADPINKRIQVFDENGKFLTKWSVPEWGQPVGFEDLAIDSHRGRLYASSTHLDAVLVFDLKRNQDWQFDAKAT